MVEQFHCSLEELIQKNQVVLTTGQKCYIGLKHLGEVLICGLALVFLFPLLVVIAAIIKKESPKEKVLFCQERVGRNGKTFRLYKFRSMRSDAPSELSTSEFVDAEKYITGIGRLMRKTSLDELPQLLNVVKGDMSLIGPRPLVKSEQEMHFLRSYYGVYQVRPGITGLAQVNGRDNMDDYTKARWDRAYVRNLSFGLDCAIFFKTIRDVIVRKNVVDNAEEKLLHNYADGLTKEEYDATVREYRQNAQRFGIDTEDEFSTVL